MAQAQVRVPWPGWLATDYLGGGSFGSVYKIQRRIGDVTEYAAMKVIRLPKDKNEINEMLESGFNLQSVQQSLIADLEYVKREYGMMAMLKGNANVVYCDDIMDEKNADGIGWTMYIRMELLTPLNKVLTESFNENQVIKVGKDICNVLVACKARNIIHRDIKPANIMVSSDGNYKLGDFGVAKILEDNSGGTKTGTYNFMAPEVYNNRPYGISADIYSLGMVLYWMLNRRSGPFLPLPPTMPTALQADEAKQRRFRGEALPPPACGSEALKRIVLKACAFNPDLRYSSPEALYADLAKLSSDSATSFSKASGYSKEKKTSYNNHKVDISPDDKSLGNSWSGEYDKTQGSVKAENQSGGTVGATIGADAGRRMGSFDIRGKIQATAQELASGCVKPFITGTGKKINVTVKAGTTVGTVLRLVGAGKEDSATGAKGNAYVTVILAENKQKDFWGQNTKKESTAYSGVIPSAFAKRGGERTFDFKDGKKKNLQIPANCKDGQIVDGVKIYVHDFTTKKQNMEQLPDAVLEMYASKSLGLIRGFVFAFLFWMIFGIFTMAIPVMAGGILVHFTIVLIRGIKKGEAVQRAADILKDRKNKNISV